MFNKVTIHPTAGPLRSVDVAMGCMDNYDRLNHAAHDGDAYARIHKYYLDAAKQFVAKVNYCTE